MNTSLSDSEVEEYIVPISLNPSKTTAAAVINSNSTLPTTPQTQSSSKKKNEFKVERFGEGIAGVISAMISVILMLGLYFSHLMFIFLPWIETRQPTEDNDFEDFYNTPLWILLAFMTLFIIMGLWSFFMAMLTSNRVKPVEKLSKMKKSDVDINTNNTNINNTNASNNNNNQTETARYWCRRCDREKPPRSHHCSICNECILRMDHHCPWINNCVGFRNHGHYLRFLFYVTMSMLTGLILMSIRFYSFSGRYLYWGNHHGRFSMHVTAETMQMTFLVADIVGCGILSLIIGLLMIVQISNVSHGYTTIEALEIDRCEKDLQQHIPFPYDLGFWPNLRAVFGENVVLWPFPIPLRVESDGCSFETRPDALMDGIWPLPPSSAIRQRHGSLDDGGGYIITNKVY